MLIAYVGFSQNGGSRLFKFEGRLASRPGYRPKSIELMVTADMAVMARLRVKFQDLPALCQRTLAEAVEALPEGEQTLGTYELTEASVRAFTTANANPERADHRKRFRPKPPQTSQLQWPKRV